MANDDVVQWLLGSDPALRWQVERDLAHAPEDVWRATRARVAIEGFGARLLALQDADGQWAGGAYFPADFDFQGPEAAEGAGQPWTATTWALNTLRDWGVDAAVLGDTAERLVANSRWEYDNLPYWGGEVDCCINGYTLANGAWLGADVSGLVDWFLEHQLADGGWNCNWVEGSTRSSFHSTLNSLKGLLYYESVTGGTDAIREARRNGEEYLLRRNLYRRLLTGEPVAYWVSRFVYPFRWFYSVLNGPITSARPPFLRIGHRIRVWRRRSSRSAPPGSRTAPGSRNDVIPAACGSRSTWMPVNPRSGSRTTGPKCSSGGMPRTLAARQTLCSTASTSRLHR
jgi:hypothetical protein